MKLFYKRVDEMIFPTQIKRLMDNEHAEIFKAQRRFDSRSEKIAQDHLRALKRRLQELEEPCFV